MARVAFVYPPVEHHSFEENLRVVDEDFGVLPPLSLAYAAAIAQNAGHDVLLVDANALRLSEREVLRQLRSFRADVVCCSLSTYMFRVTTRWMKYLKSQLGVPIIAGGVNLRLYPNETLNGVVDYGVTHFATRGLPALLEALGAGRDPVGLPEVVARDSRGEVVIGPVDRSRNPYLDLPLPARHLLKNDVYCSIVSQRKSFTVMVTSTGCPFRCRYCAIPGVPRYLNPVSKVMAEIEACVRHHGIREIDFFDADFFAERRRAEEICRRLIASGLDLEWSCRTRVDLLTRETLELASRAGCKRMYVGIETPNTTALRRMHKNVKTDAHRATLRLMRDFGIRPLGFFMLGVDGETHVSASKTIAYSLRLPLDYAQFSRMIAKPGSALARDLTTATGEDYWRDYVSRHVVPGRPKNIWSGIGDQAIEAYTKLAYLLFYYRPSFILRTLARVRSAEELARGVRTAARMLIGFVADSDVRAASRSSRRP